MPLRHLYHVVDLRDMGNINKLSKYLWCNCYFSFILNFITKQINYANMIFVVVALLFYVHGKHLRSCRDGQLT